MNSNERWLSEDGPWTVQGARRQRQRPAEVRLSVGSPVLGTGVNRELAVTEGEPRDRSGCEGFSSVMLRQ